MALELTAAGVQNVRADETWFLVDTSKMQAQDPVQCCLLRLFGGLEYRMSKLTWDDLVIQDISPEQFRDWLSPWNGVVTGRVAPAFMSKFGLWFLRRPEGHVEILDVISGELSRIADSYEDFIKEVNQQWWQETVLFSKLVLQLHQAEKIPGPGQCYALAPHPALGGPNPFAGDAIDPSFVMVTDIIVWQSICAQTHGFGQ